MFYKTCMVMITTSFEALREKGLIMLLFGKAQHKLDKTIFYFF